MNSKKFICLGVIVACSYLSVSAKNVKIKNLKCNVAYRDTPQKPLKPIHFTYTTEVVLGTSLSDLDTNDVTDKELNIEGQQRLQAPQDGSYHFIFTMSSPSIGESQVGTDVQTDSNHRTITFYYIQVPYSYQASMKVMLGNKVIKTIPYATVPQVYKTSEANNLKDVSVNFRNNKEDILTKIDEGAFTWISQFLGRSLSVDYGFPTEHLTQEVKITEDKNCPENDNFRTASQSLKTKLEALTPNEPLKEADVDDLIKYYANIPTKYPDPKEKADKKIRYAAYYDLCVINFYMENFDQVKKYANLIIDNDESKGDGNKFLKEVTKLTDKFSKEPVKTRYFNPENYFKKE